jgi:hypothetical protein
VGDEQYNGAVPLNGGEEEGEITTPPSQQLLALQCCEVEFPDAEYETVWSRKRRRDVVQGRPSNDRTVHASLSQAWWTPLLTEYMSSESAFGAIDYDIRISDTNAKQDSESTLKPSHLEEEAKHTPTNPEYRPDLLPPPIMISPGRNKYVVGKLRDPVTHKNRWFVKSASPEECGGPYHANIADDLEEWIRSVPGFESAELTITGGGRIDYVPSSRDDDSEDKTENVLVYGFSYRYGKGDHSYVASLIQQYFITNNTVDVSYDTSDDLY